MPGGATSSSPTVISTLPYTDTDTVTQGSPKWYLYTAPTPVNPVEFGCFVSTPDFSGLTPLVFTQVFSPTALIQLTNYAAMRKPFQVALAAGMAYYLRVSGSGAGVPHAYTISVYAGPTASAPAGSLFVSDDTAGFPLAILSGSDGTVLRFVSPFPAGESADVIATGAHQGRILVYDKSTAHLVLYDPQFTVLTDIAYRSLADLSDHTFSIRTNRAISTFYVSDPKDTGHGNKQTVTTVSSAGVLGPTTWVLPNQGPLIDGGLAPSLDETILYVVNSANTNAAPVNRWDLVNNVALSDLVAGIVGYSTYEILVLADGTLVVMYQNNTSANAPMAQHYAANGTTLNTYTFTGSASFDTRLASAPDDPVSFWAWTKLATGTGLSRFTNVQVSDGAVLTTFDALQYQRGVYNTSVGTNLNPQPRFGHSESCPFLITRPSPITGTIDVTAPHPNALALTGYPLPPRHLEALCRTIMTIAALSPDARQQMFNALGVILSGGKLLTQEAGTTTNLAPYSDSALTVPNSNPVIADASGLLPPIYLLPQAYKFSLYDSNDLLQWTQDNVFDVGELLQATITTLQAQVTANLALTETKFCTTQLTMNSTAALANITGLTGFTLAASGVYAFEINLSGTSTANGGLKIGFKYTTATLTNIDATAQGFTASAVAVQHTTTTTDQATLFGQTAAVISIRIVGRLTVNVAGTLAVQAAQNAAHADTSSVFTGSWATFTKVS